MLSVVERFMLLLLALSGVVFAIRYFFTKEEKQITARFVFRAILSVVIALLLLIPFFFLNNLSGL